MDVNSALNIAKSAGIDPTTLTSGLSQETLNQGAELAQNVASGKNPVASLLKLINNAVKKPGQVKQGVQNATEAVVDQVGNTAQQAFSNASQVFSNPLTPQELITRTIYIAWLSRIIVFGITTIWLVVSIVSNYTESFSQETKDKIQSINDFISKYLIIFIGLYVLWIIYGAQIAFLPYAGEAINFFVKLNDSARVLLNTFAGLNPMA